MFKPRSILLSFFFCSFWIHSFSQLDHSSIFLNYKRSIPSNFLNAEYQIGNKDARSYLCAQVGVNNSSYSSEKHTPYYTGTVALDPNFKFSEYISSKKGFQFGLGYTFYFMNLENEKRFIPYLGIDINWIKSYDEYSHEYTQEMTGMVSLLDKKYDFTTLTSNLQFGFIFTTEWIYYRFSFACEYFLPVNDVTYMPTDSYNVNSSRKLPLVGLEPNAQLGIGFKLF